MAYTDIDKPTDYFNTVTYTGDMVDGDGTGHTQSITGVGFQPNWVWHKGRSGARTHILVDSVRGTSSYNWLITNSSSPEITANDNGAIKSIDSNGITLENGADSSSKSNNAGKNGETYVFWNWLAGGSASSNEDGSITSTVSASTDAGFSIVSWTGSGSAATIGHGLGATPKCIIVKNRTDNVNWFLYNHSVITAGASNKSFMTLNTTDALGTNGSATTFTSVSSTTFGVGTDNIINGSSDNMIAYVFAEKKGYSKFGSYTGNGNADGTFVYTGFKPAFLIIKKSSAIEDWGLIDNKRDPNNDGTSSQLFPNTNGAEDTSNDRADFLSNGFKLRTSSGQWNTSGGTYIYMAFAENPFVTSTGIPTTAR